MPGTFSNVLLHIIYSTKHRRPMIEPELRERLFPFLGGIAWDERCPLLAVGGMPDHVHLLVKWRTDTTIADLARHLKSRSSLWIHKEFRSRPDFAWQEGYGVFGVSESMRDTVLNYIRNQEEHHRTRTFEEEFISFLKAHHVEYDPKYVFD